MRAVTVTFACFSDFHRRVRVTRRPVVAGYPRGPQLSLAGDRHGPVFVRARRPRPPGLARRLARWLGRAMARAVRGGRAAAAGWILLTAGSAGGTGVPGCDRPGPPRKSSTRPWLRKLDRV